MAPNGIKVPVARAKATFLSELAHGRRGLTTGGYRPHIVLGPTSQRVALRKGTLITEDYLGVLVVGGPESMNPGDTAEVALALMYLPELKYEGVVAGATFTIREGPNVVGFGTILERRTDETWELGATRRSSPTRG